MRFAIMDGLLCLHEDRVQELVRGCTTTTTTYAVTREVCFIVPSESVHVGAGHDGDQDTSQKQSHHRLGDGRACTDIR
jgi:hypothetical protein